MRQIFINLKRFEAPRSQGGLCPLEDPVEWIQSVMDETVALGLGQVEGLRLTYFLPEGLVYAASRRLLAHPPEATRGLAIGCQGLHWEDIRPGKNFGAFTSSLPGVSAVGLGSRWAMLGHSEERRAKLGVIRAFEPGLDGDETLRLRAARAVDRLLQAEVTCALEDGLNVLLCVGETADERGGGSFGEQQPRIEAVLKAQLETGLEKAGEAIAAGRVAIGYEPVWAIGPGKTPPGAEYIAFVSAFVKHAVRALHGAEIPVVYGGGLKEENAAMIAGIATLDGGLVGLTRFTGEIGFDVTGLKGIVEKYLE